MAELVRVRQVLTVPCYQKIALVERRNRQMKRITCWIFWHNLMRDVCLHNVSDGLADLEERKVGDQFERVLFTGERAAFQLSSTASLVYPP